MRDEDLNWIKELIINHIHEKPVVEKFKNGIQQMLYKNYHKLRIINDILYYIDEDREGKEKAKYVVPENLVTVICKSVQTLEPFWRTFRN